MVDIACPVRMYTDVRDVTAARIRDDIGYLPQVIVGSPPCQDASCAFGRGIGVSGSRTGLFFEAIRIVMECQPIWACFENVAGIRVRGIERVIGGLEKIGYTCWPLVVGSRDVGAPVVGRRLWLVAVPSETLEKRPQGRFGKGGGICRTENPTPTKFGNEVVSCGPRWPKLDEYLCVGNGLPKSMVRKVIAAYGDAVVPQITEAIGRMMMRLAPTDGTVLDLFCGAAFGWSLGMHRAGYRTVAACEIDDWRRSVAMQHAMEMYGHA